jgi:hypothetical protein
MKKAWLNAEYLTNLVVNNSEGWTALELHMRARGASCVAARVVFWDAAGQFFLEVALKELPLDVVEEFVAEARSTIKVT